MSEQMPFHDTEHMGMINDSQFDFFGTRLATADSDGVVKVCRMQGDQVIAQSTSHLVDIDIGSNTAHQGPCWSVAWAHPKYESIIATSGYDKQVKFWKETSYNNWKCIFKYETQGSVNSIQFCPWEYGLFLAAGVADGSVHIISYNQGNWQSDKMMAHDSGITGLSWGPPSEPCLLLAENNDYKNQQEVSEKSYTLISKRFVTSSMDNKAKIWQENPATNKFQLVAELKNDQNSSAHDDWVRDVAWCNNVGIMKDLIATCGEDQKLKIWKNESSAQKGATWKLAFETSFNEPCWKCSWSPVGFMLAVSCGDNQTRVFKQANNNKQAQDQGDEVWAPISEINDKGELMDTSNKNQNVNIDH